MMSVQQRRWIARLIKVGLVGAAVVVVMAWIGSKRDGRMNVRIDTDDHVRAETRVGGRGRGAAAEARPVEALGPGDLRIYNQDSSVNLVLRGAEILAGLSPQMRERITAEIAQKAGDDTTGFGAAIAGVVKSTVASAIAMHAVYPVRDIRDIEYRDGQIVIWRRNGGTVELLDNVKTDGTEISRTFAREDALRFVEAVRERKAQLERR